MRLAEEAESAMRELRDLRRGRVLIGANEAAVHTLLPLIGRFRRGFPDIAIDVRRVPARQIAVEVQQGSLDFGALTFHPPEEGLLEVPVGSDELVLLVAPSHELAGRRQVTIMTGGTSRGPQRPVGARARPLAASRAPHHAPADRAAQPHGISARYFDLGVALPSRRCAITEIVNKRPWPCRRRGVAKTPGRSCAARRTDRTPDAFLKWRRNIVVVRTFRPLLNRQPEVCTTADYADTAR